MRIGIGLLLLQTVLPQSARAQQDAGTPIPVQMGFRVSPDTVIIGQPFNLFVKIAAPMGVRFEFPAGPDTAMQNGVRPIELRGEKLVSMLGDTAVALYHLVAWDVGVQPLRIPDVRAALGGNERRLTLSGASVFVKSVLPADTSLRIPKPPRSLIVLPVFNWWPWLALAAAIIAATLLWGAWRRYRNRPQAPMDPYVRVQQEFERIERMGLVEADRGPEYLASMVDAAREYLAARVPGVRRSDTTSELLRAMEPHDGVEVELPRLLDRADLVKFAGDDLPRNEAREAGLAVRAIVDHVEARLNPESEPAKQMATRERAA